MRTIETTATVGADHTLTIGLPDDIPPGEHRVIVVIDGILGEKRLPPVQLPIHDLGPWPEGLSLRREDMYDDWGR